MKKYILYCLYDKTTLEIRYVGITSQKLYIRLKQHKKSSDSGKNLHKINWIKSVNNNIDIRQLKVDLTFTEARELELILIHKYKVKHNLVNLQDRGACGDLRVLCKDYCEKISNTLKAKYKNGSLPIQGEKGVFIYSNTGKYLGNFPNARECSKFLKIPYSKIGCICNKGGYYGKYTFSREHEIPFSNYIKCFDIVEGKLSLFFKKEELSLFLKVKGTPYNKCYNKDFFYKNRYNIRLDNLIPPLQSSLVSCNGKFYTNISKILLEYKTGGLLNYSEIRKHLRQNIVYIRGDFEIKNVYRARYKLDELRETLI